MTQLNRNLSEAAQVHGLGRGAIMRRVTGPMLAVPLFSAWLLATTHIMFELPMSELLYPAGQPPLPVALVSYTNNFDFSLGAALELEAVALVLVVVAVLRWLFNRFVPVGWRRSALQRGRS